MRAPFRIAAAIALISGLAVGLASHPVAAGVSQGFTITYEVTGGDDPASVGAGLDLELFDSTGTLVNGCTENGADALRQLRCGTGGQTALADGTYTVGVGAVPADYFVADVECNNFRVQEARLQIDATEFPEASIDYVDGDAWRCTVRIEANPITTVDVVVNNDAGGTAAPSDFTVEFFDATDTIVATATDPAAGTCVLTGPSIGVCGEVQITPGDYTLGISPLRGYVATGAFCVPSFPNGGTGSLQLPGTQGDVTITNTDQPCQITMTYVQQTVTADVVITSDDDGTATTADFLIEILDGDTVVASGTDPEPGIGNAQFSAVLPVGDYTVRVTGPDTYTLEVIVTPVDIGVAEASDLLLATQANLTVSGSFTLSQTQSASITATANDVAPLATTTTVAPTTSTSPPTGVLPETGTASSGLLLWGFVLLLFGSGVMLITRRA